MTREASTVTLGHIRGLAITYEDVPKNGRSNRCVLTSDPNRPSEPVASIRFYSHQITCKPTRLFASGCQIGQLQSIYIVERSLARDAEIIAGHGGSSPVFQTRTRGYPRFLDGTHGD
jgi:hypothetical protein